MNKTICPKCNGEKYILPAFPNKKMLETPIEELKEFFKCQVCKGNGMVTDEMLQWIKDGDILKDKRINAKLLLREAARSLNINPSILSEMERGVIKPDNSLIYT